MSGLKDTYDELSDWVSPSLFFSKRLQWGETGLIGVIADFILYATKGDILEIGVGVSSIYLTALSKKYNRKAYHCDSNADKMESIREAGYFSPTGELFTCLSDEMFSKATLTPLAFVFIDGYHGYDQVKRDFWNAEKHLVPNGCILLHDSYPPSEDYCRQEGSGNGDVYKFRQELEKDNRFDVFTFVCDPLSPQASTLVRKKPEARPYYQE